VEDVKQPCLQDPTQAPDMISADATNRKQTPAQMKAPGPRSFKELLNLKINRAKRIVKIHT